MILAGDIGGTKTLLSLISSHSDPTQPLLEERYLNREFDGIDAILENFLQKTDQRPRMACFGVAGRISGRCCRITNLPWTVDADTIGCHFNIDRVVLINDLHAVATAVPYLSETQLETLNPGHRDTAGAVGVIAPGTGLGESFLTWTGTGYQAWPSEGGHASFAPVTLEQRELLEFLEQRFGHVSFERVCSGSGIPSIYEFLLATGRYEEPDWLKKEISCVQDPTPLLITRGYQCKAPICIATLDLFVRILGGVAGNMALKVMATGGLFLWGGIVRHIHDRLQKKDFLNAVCYKGRFKDWLSQIPIHIILDPKAALHGAAWHALQIADRKKYSR